MTHTDRDRDSEKDIETCSFAERQREGQTGAGVVTETIKKRERQTGISHYQKVEKMLSGLTEDLTKTTRSKSANIYFRACRVFKNCFKIKCPADGPNDIFNEKDFIDMFNDLGKEKTGIFHQVSAGKKTPCSLPKKIASHFFFTINIKLFFNSLHSILNKLPCLFEIR